MKKTVVGLTGGIASGKSVAADILREAGAYIIDTDIISREISQSDEVAREIFITFPQAHNGGELNRKKLREIVFSDSAAKNKLENILHPRILRETERLIAESCAQVTAVVVPLLFESGFNKLTDKNITVSCDESVRIKRLIKRDDISGELAENMIKSQLSDGERERNSDIVITNNGSLAELRAQVLRVYYELLQ